MGVSLYFWNHHAALVEMKTQVFPEETCKSHSAIKSFICKNLETPIKTTHLK